MADAKNKAATTNKLTKPNDTASVISSFSALTTSETAQQRFQVIKEGYLEISRAGTKETSGKTEKFSFANKFCHLTRDGRLIMDDNVSKEKIVIQECTVIDARMFRLNVLSELDLSVKDPIELLCRGKTDEEGTDWLISIETALRSRLIAFRNELDCARGHLAIVEKMGKKLNFDASKAKQCQCFYYNNTLRVKGMDGPQTSSFTILNLQTDEINLPMCFIISTPGRDFICRADDVDSFRKWIYNIQKDIDKQKQKNVPTTSAVNNDLKSELLLGPTEDKMIRVTAHYRIKDRILEITDFAGVVDVFYVQRCIISPEMAKTNSGNLLLLVSLATDESESNTLKLFMTCAPEKLKKWLESFAVNRRNFLLIIETIIMQIELRRIMKNENSSDKRKRVVTFHDAHYLLSLSEKEIEEVLTKVDEWPVARLERLIQIILKCPAEPIIPYSLQKDFIDLGTEITVAKQYKDSHCKKASEIIEKMDHFQRELMEKMTLHIFRLTSHYNKKKESANSQTNSQQKVTISNHDLTVWIRLSKYIFRFNEQGIDDAAVDRNVTLVSQVIVCYQAKYVEDLRRQAEKSSSKTKRADFDQNCRQQ